MEQLEELQGRIQAALDRIGGGVVALEEKHANRPVPTLEELDMQNMPSCSRISKTSGWQMRS